MQHEAQQNRIQAVEDLCRRENLNARHNVQFIREVQPQLVPQAKRIFRLTPNCHTIALHIKPNPSDVP